MLEDSRSNSQKPVRSTALPEYMPNLGAAIEQATLGSSISIKGDVWGAESLYIDGHIEGSVHFAGQRVTVGRSSVVTADVEAREVIIIGRLTGNISGSERVDIRGEATFTGDIVTQRISIDEGAIVKGRVRVKKPGRQEEEEASTAKAAITAAGEIADGVPKAPAKDFLPEPAKVTGAAAPQSSARVAGSRVLFEVKPGAR